MCAGGTDLSLVEAVVVIMVLETFRWTQGWSIASVGSSDGRLRAQSRVVCYILFLLLLLLFFTRDCLDLNMFALGMSVKKKKALPVALVHSYQYH